MTVPGQAAVRTINAPVLTGGVVLMLCGYGLYRLFSPSPHGYPELFFALPVFCLGLAFSGAAFVMERSPRWRRSRLCFGWALILLAAAPFLHLLWRVFHAKVLS